MHGRGRSSTNGQWGADAYLQKTADEAFPPEGKKGWRAVAQPASARGLHEPHVGLITDRHKTGREHDREILPKKNLYGYFSGPNCAKRPRSNLQRWSSGGKIAVWSARWVRDSS